MPPHLGRGFLDRPLRLGPLRLHLHRLGSLGEQGMYPRIDRPLRLLHLGSKTNPTAKNTEMGKTLGFPPFSRLPPLPYPKAAKNTLTPQKTLGFPPFLRLPGVGVVAVGRTAPL